MARLSKVWVWPASGKAHKPWDEIPENDSFLKTSRRVSEAFRRELEKRGIRTRDGEIEITLGEVDESEIAVQAVERGVLDGPETAEISVSRDFHHLDPYTRAFFVADALHAVTTRLGLVHGWDLTAIDAAMDAVRENDYAYSYTSDWKSNDDSTRRVRLRARLLDDGFGRVRFEFVGSEPTSIAVVTAEVVAGTSRRDFVRMAKSLAWSGTTTMIAKGLGRGFAASAESGEIRSLDIPLRPLANSAEVNNRMPLPHIRVDDPPPISFTMGGGPINKVPKKYIAELDMIFAHLCFDPEWVEWWLGLGVADVELEYDFEVKNTKTKVSLSPDRITCTIARPASSVGRGLLGKAMAHADVAVLLDVVHAKTGRTSHPAIPMEFESS
jgi:hypothetical protein